MSLRPTGPVKFFVAIAEIDARDGLHYYEYLGTFTKLEEAQKAGSHTLRGPIYNVLVIRTKLNQLDDDEDHWDIVWTLNGGHKRET